MRRSTPNTILINVCQVCSEVSLERLNPRRTDRVLLLDEQKGNPVITNIRSVAWEYGDIKADYQVGATSGALYLSFVLLLLLLVLPTLSSLSLNPRVQQTPLPPPSPRVHSRPHQSARQLVRLEVDDRALRCG